MPFVVPPSTRGQYKPQKSVFEVLLTRFGDLIAGAGLERYRVDLDLKQEAEEMMPSGRGAGGPQSPTTTTTATNERNDEQETAGMLGAQPDERVLINKFGAHFVFIPSLGRFIARADRKSVRASTISGRVCYALQLLMVLVGLYCLTLRTVECGIVDSGATATKVTAAPPSDEVLTTIHPGWRHVVHDRNPLYILLFLAMLLGGSAFQGFLVRNGDSSAGNPGFISLDGDEVQFQQRVDFAGGGDSGEVLSVPHELRKSCKTCGIAQPLRCRHCKSCGRCVPRSDHHCFWLGHCVGSFDYGSFVLLIWLMAVSVAMGLGLLCGSWLDIYKECGVPGTPGAGWFHRQMHANGFLLLMIIVVLCAAVVLSILFISHVVFTVIETTTYEFARSGKNSYMRYYSVMGSNNGKRGGGQVSSSPFANPSFVGNFTALWWFYGMKSFRGRFRKFLPAAVLKAGGDDGVESGSAVLRCGSVDGINFFVRAGGGDGGSNSAAEVV